MHARQRVAAASSCLSTTDVTAAHLRLYYIRAQGNTYEKQLKNLSWPVASDLPAHAQPSAQHLMPQAYNVLHPMEFATARETYQSSFANQYGSFGMHVEPSPRKQSVHQRLFTPSRNLTHVGFKFPVTQAEQQADAAFAAGRYDLAVKGYTLAINHKASLFCYEKRCAALAHVGRYREALSDAKYVLSNGAQGEAESGPNKQRVKAIESFLANQNVGAKGFHEAPATLMCLLTPKGLRQWRTFTPSTYTRPYPFGASVVCEPTYLPQY